MTRTTIKTRPVTVSTQQLQHEFVLPRGFPSGAVAGLAGIWRDTIRGQVFFWKQRQPEPPRWRIEAVQVELVQRREGRVVLETKMTVLNGASGYDKAQVENAVRHARRWFEMTLSVLCGSRPSLSVNRESPAPAHCGQL